MKALYLLLLASLLSACASSPAAHQGRNGVICGLKGGIEQVFHDKGYPSLSHRAKNGTEVYMWRTRQNGYIVDKVVYANPNGCVR